MVTAESVPSFLLPSIFTYLKGCFQIIMKNRLLPNGIIWLTQHQPQDMLQILLVFYLVWNLLENVLAAQGLIEK